MWREGARVHDPKDTCPGCGANACHFASDFNAWGKRSVRACTACRSVFVNQKYMGDLEVHILPKQPDATAIPS